MRRQRTWIVGVGLTALATVGGAIVVSGGSKRADAVPIASEQSPDKRYRVDVYRWPVGATSIWKSDSYVRMVMIDQASGEVKWELEPYISRQKGAPSQYVRGPTMGVLQVTNGGCVVYQDWTRGWRVVQGDGRQARETQLDVVGTSAAAIAPGGLSIQNAPVFEGRSLKHLRVSSVIDSKGKEYLVFRTVEGRRVVFRARGAERLEMAGFDSVADVTQVDPLFTEIVRVLSAIVVEEAEWSRGVLERTKRELQEGGLLANVPAVEVVQAMHIAGHYKRADMADLVKSIETTLLAADRSTIDWSRWIALVRTTLRRMGQPLGAWGGYDLRVADRLRAAGSLERDCELPARATREEMILRAEMVKVGMSVAELADLLGGAEYRLGTWHEWDIDADVPYTLWVHVEHGHAVQVSRILPARWQVGSGREIP